MNPEIRTLSILLLGALEERKLILHMLKAEFTITAAQSNV